MDAPYELYLGDCLEIMPQFPDKSFDMILCDLPYGTTARNKWDVVLSFDELWKQYIRLIKENGAVLLFADEPFTSKLICSNSKFFRQRITWDKDKASGFPNAKRMLMKQTEDVVLFSLKSPLYNPQMVDADPKRVRPLAKKSTATLNYNEFKEIGPSPNFNPTKRYPTNLVKFSSIAGDCNSAKRLHPTQKPVGLCEWLIKTYTNHGATVLDNCMGSGTTGVACANLGRRFIGIENEEKYYWISQERIAQAYKWNQPEEILG